MNPFLSFHTVYLYAKNTVGYFYNYNIYINTLILKFI